MKGKPTKEASAPPPTETGTLRSSLTLLSRAQAGDRVALESLIGRYLPRLQRWATGRLPQWARGMTDTQDLVQETLVQTFTFQRLEQFEVRGPGALYGYLRQAILNRIRDELRRAKRQPSKADLDPHTPDPGRSPLEEAIGQQAIERYERALAALRPEDRQAVIARIELGYTHEEIADLLGKPTANAARMAVERAIVRLASQMRDGEA